jgi:hypothetical protein
MVASATEPERLVFVDEMGTNTSLAPLCMPGRAERSTSALFGAAQLGSERLTLLASMSLWGIGASLAVEGATTKAVFEAYVERVLAPELKPGQR